MNLKIIHNYGVRLMEYMDLLDPAGVSCKVNSGGSIGTYLEKGGIQSQTEEIGW